MKKVVLVAILLVTLFCSTRIHATTDQGILTITKLSTTATQYQTNCYFLIQISMNLSWTNSQSLYRISTNNFWLLITTPNVQVTNASDSIYKNPNNLIRSFNIFPNVPVNLILGFGPTCLPTVSTARLIYLDSRFNFTFTLP